MNQYLNVLTKYATFKGRASRTEYWYFYLFNFIIITIIQISLILSTENIVLNKIYQVLIFLYPILIITPSLAVAVRRMHDIGRSGLWLLINLVPLIGIIWFLILTLLGSNPGENKYGDNPKNLNAV